MNVERYLIHTIYVSSVATTNAKGVSTYGAPTAVRARVWERHNVVENSQGESVATSHVVQLTRQLKPNDRVWLESASTSNVSAALTPFAITAYPSLAGDATLYEVTLG